MHAALLSDITGTIVTSQLLNRCMAQFPEIPVTVISNF